MEGWVDIIGTPTIPQNTRGIIPTEPEAWLEPYAGRHLCRENSHNARLNVTLEIRPTSYIRPVCIFWEILTNRGGPAAVCML